MWVNDYERNIFKKSCAATYNFALDNLLLELILCIPSLIITLILMKGEIAFSSMYITLPSVFFLGFLLGIFARNIFITSHQTYREQEEKICSLEKRLPGELNIEVDVKSYYGMVSGPYGRITEGGWLIVLQNVRITNRSKTNKVSLGFALKIGLKNSPSKRDDWTLNQDHLLMLDQLPNTFLVGPLRIKPQESEKGYIGFLILPKIREFLGDEAIIYNKAELEITDHISNKNIKIALPSNAYYESTNP